MTLILAHIQEHNLTVFMVERVALEAIALEIVFLVIAPMAAAAVHTLQVLVRHMAAIVSMAVAADEHGTLRSVRMARAHMAIMVQMMAAAAAADIQLAMQ